MNCKVNVHQSRGLVRKAISERIGMKAALLASACLIGIAHSPAAANGSDLVVGTSGETIDGGGIYHYDNATINDGGTLAVRNVLTSTILGISGDFTGITSGTIDLSDGAAIVVNGTTSLEGEYTLNIDGGGTQTVFTATSGITLTGTSSGQALAVLSNGGALNIGSLTGGAYDGTLTLAGTGMTGAALVIGATASNSPTVAGTLNAASVSLSWQSAILFNHTATQTGAYEFSADIVGNGTINQTAGWTRLTGDNSGFSGSTAINGGGLIVENGLGGRLEFLTSGAFIVYGEDGNATLSNDELYVGDVTNVTDASQISLIEGGTLTVGSNGSGTIYLGSENGTGSEGQLWIGAPGATYTAGTLNAGGIVTYANGSVHFSHSSTDYDFDTVISGDGSIYQLAGITTLSADNSAFSGTTTITGGTLTVTGQLGGTISFGSSANFSDGNLIVTGSGASVTHSDSELVAGVSAGADHYNLITLTDGGTLNIGTEVNGTYDGTITLGISNTVNQVTAWAHLAIGADYGETAAEAGFLNAASVVLNDTGSLVFNHTTSNYMFDSDISGSGSIYHQAGTTLLTGDSSDFTGAVSISGGQFVVSGSLGSSTTNVSGGAWVGVGGAMGAVWTATDWLKVGGNTGTSLFLIGQGGTVNVGDGVNGAYEGTVTLAEVSGSSGMLIIGNIPGSSPSVAGILNAGSVEFGDGYGVIVFNHTSTLADVYDFDTQISGDGSVQILAGVTTLSANNAGFTGIVNISGGTLLVNNTFGGNTFAADVSVSNGGVLMGTGRVGTSAGASARTVTFGNGGILSPGEDGYTGSLTIYGNTTFNTGSVYAVDVTGNGIDYTQIEGDLTINGGAVQLTALDASISYQGTQTRQILSASGTRTGEFDELINNSAFLNASLSYQGNAVYMAVSLVNQNPFSTIAQTRNQKQLGTVLDGLEQSGSSLELYNSLLVLDEDTALDTMNQLDGDIHATSQGALVQTLQGVNNTTSTRIRSLTGSAGLPSGNTPILGYADDGKKKEDPFKAVDADSKKASDVVAERFAVWGSAFGSWGSVDGQNGNAKTDMASGGFLTGADTVVMDDWRAGLMAGYSRSFFSSGTSKGRSTNIHLGAYTGATWNAFALRSGVNYTWHDLDTSRSVTALGQSLTGKYDGGSLNAFGEVAYKVDTTVAAFEPFAGVAHTFLKTDGFTETGGSAALTVDESEMNTTFTTLGLRVSREFLVGGMLATARGSAGWQHAFGDIDPVTTARFAGSDSFTAASTPLDEDVALVETGFDLGISRSSTLSFSYNGQFGANAREHGINGRFRLAF